MRKRRRLQLESLEHRTVLNVGPIGILNLSADHASWSLNSPAGASEIPIRAEGPLSGWTPEQLGDFTGDGVDDVLGRVTNGDWWLQVNDGTQLLTIPWGSALDDGAEILGTADVNGDNKLDVLSLDRATGTIWVSASQSSGGLSNEVWGTLPTGTWDNLFIDDFDGDDTPDLIGSHDDTWWLAKNQGGSFGVEQWGRFPDFNWVDVFNGDFDGDNLGDIAARAPDNTWWVWFGTDSGFQPAQYWHHWRMRSDWHDVSVADFNNDGRDDLIGRTEDGRLWVGSSTDTRFHTWTWSKGWVDRAEWSQIHHVDMNADGFVDQVGKAKDDTWWYAQNTGAMSFQNYFWQQVDVGEFLQITDDFHADEVAHDVIAALPTGGIDVNDIAVTATLNGDGKLVIDGSGLSLAGIELRSESSSLIPFPGENPSPGPFDLMLANRPDVIAFGNFQTGVPLDGPLVLDIGWNTSNNARDLEISYGLEDEVETQPALASDPLSRATVQDVYSMADRNKVYFDTLPIDVLTFE